ncbi:MAG: peptidylprolyl isomerase [Alphaproteobacteria bacterium]
MLPQPAPAQQVQSIAAIVNDQVISGFDVEQRISLAIVSSRLRDTPETRRRIRGQVLRNLIDETLQLQEAQRTGIKVSDQEVERAFRSLEQQNRMPAGGLTQFLESNGIAKQTLERQVSTEIAWTRLIGRRIAPTVTIGDDEIDETLARLKGNADAELARVAEIFLPVDSPNEEPEVEATAARLVQQLRGGADFGAMARQFSRGATASGGGDIGWVQAGQLADRLDRALDGLQPGDITDPVRSTGGFYILGLVDRRKPGRTDPMQVTLALKQLLAKAPVEPEVKQAMLRTGAAIAADTQGCDALDAAAKRLAETAQVVDLGQIKLGEMPEAIRAAVADLEAGQLSQPLEIGGNVILLAVCDKEAPEVEAPSREKVAEQMHRQRATLLAHRYLRDLRRAAVVELR